MSERFIARQPIFDQQLHVHGYELLFRGKAENFFTPDPSATRQVIINSTMLLPGSWLPPQAKIFVNVTQEELLSRAALLLPAEKTIIELGSAIEPRPETLRACRTLIESGYGLALDGFTGEACSLPFLEFATYAKVDFCLTSTEVQARVGHEHARNSVHLVGTRIETRKEFQRARQAGYSFFQGYFFLRPELFFSRDLPASKFNSLRLLRETGSRELRYDAIEEILKQEPSLLYKLLRYLNSPLIGLRGEVRSVSQALTLLGELEFRRWISVVAMVAAVHDENVETVRFALTRAYFCEALAELAAAAQASEFFLMGLFSLMDVLFARPLSEVLAELPVSDAVRSALLGGEDSLLRQVLEAAIAYERADWERFQRFAGPLHLDAAKVSEHFLAALRQASCVHD